MGTAAWKAVAATVGVVAIVLAFAMQGASGQETQPEGAPPHTITVSASATIETRPDEAVVTFGVRTEDADSSAALDENAKIMNGVIVAMKALGMEQADLETTNINLAPHVIDRGTSSATTVYVASTSLEVTIGDFDVIGQAIDDGVEAGATSVRGVRFGVADPVEVRRRALQAAVETARAKADALAEAAGTSVTGVILIKEGGGERPIPSYVVGNRAMFAYDAASLSVVPPRDITTDVSIRVIWSIG